MAIAVPSTVETLSDYADALLEISIAALNTTTAGAPDRAYVSPANPTFDCCLVGSTLISTDRGPIPIRDVREGDMVWAYEDGGLVLRRVLASVVKGEQQVFRVHTRKRSVVATADHRVLRVVPTRDHSTRRNIWGEEWVRVDALQRDDVLVSMDSLPSANDEVLLPDASRLTPELAWLMGVWTGDGCYNDVNGLCFFVHGGLREKTRAAIKKVWGITVKENTERLEANSRELYESLSLVMPRSSARDKRVPSLIWHGDDATRRAFLEGYAAADGHRSNGRIEYATASSQLAAEIRMLHINLGDHVSNLAVKTRRGQITIKGTVVQDPQPLHRFFVFPESRKGGQYTLDYRGARRLLHDERLGVALVKSVEPAGVEQTYDLTVDGAENFVADGLVVHNCPMLTVVVTSLTEGTTSPVSPGEITARRSDFGSIILAGYGVWALRCAPTINGDSLPPPSEIAASALEVQEDGWALWNGLRHAHRNGEIFDGCIGVHFDGGQPINEQGGCVGWLFRIRASIPGIPL